MNDQIAAGAEPEDLQSSESMSMGASQGSNFSTTSEGLSMKEEQQLEDLNKMFENVKISPVKPGQSKSKLAKKLENFNRAFREKFGLVSGVEEQACHENVLEQRENSERESLVNNIKKRLVGKSYEEKLKYLTLLPQEWSYRKFEDEFNVTRHTVKIVKQLQQQDQEKRERKKRSDAFDKDTIELVQEFYRKPHISRQFPGENFLSVLDLMGA